MGPALSRVLLEQVAAGQRPATVRLSRPGRVVAFGRRDRVSPGYRAAVEAARQGGFPGMERISGGRAAAFTEGALSLTFTIPDARPAEGTERRFAEWSGLVRDTFRDLGADARVGAVPGEYCPGEYSINAGGRIKLAGVGQRMVKGAAHLGFVILVSGSGLVAETLAPVYSALELEYDPQKVGSLEDVVPGVGLEEVEDALLERLDDRVGAKETGLDGKTREAAASISPDFRSKP
ncbi:MAG: lipoate--protein ligase family protein [Solirubrobacterales bacterium]|nr:lipoate--protein ligase family protein [Solirubrobacterales bacterium]MCB8914986.1 lipoate--protein ligase family protein [Thermoleophilales bacterium]